MSGSREREFATPIGPATTKVAVINVGTTHAHVDLTSSPIADAITKRRILTLKAEGDVYYRWSTATSGEEVDPADTTTDKRCQIIFAGERVDEVPPVGTQGIVVEAVLANTKLRIHVGSESFTG